MVIIIQQFCPGFPVCCMLKPACIITRSVYYTDDKLMPANIVSIKRLTQKYIGTISLPSLIWSQFSPSNVQYSRHLSNEQGSMGKDHYVCVCWKSRSHNTGLVALLIRTWL